VPSNESPDEAASPVVCEDVTREFTRGRESLFSRNEDRPTVEALVDVSVSVSPGEFTVIAGASGSGKTTLLHLLAGLDTPTDGTVTIDGTSTADLSPAERAALRLDHVGIVFQHFHLLPALSARDNVGLPLIERGIGAARRRQQAESLLEEVGIGDRASHRPGELSGGEQQRVAIARALVTDPALLVADEPTGELDTATGAEIIDLFTDVADTRSVVAASHDERVIESADRVIQLQDGEIIDDR
jgi:putative ABC transport system ATP-binding protein